MCVCVYVCTLVCTYYGTISDTILLYNVPSFCMPFVQESMIQFPRVSTFAYLSFSLHKTEEIFCKMIWRDNRFKTYLASVIS